MAEVKPKISYMTTADKTYMDQLAVKISPSKHSQNNYKLGYIDAFDLQAIKIMRLFEENKELSVLRTALKTACQHLYEGKIQFAPNTTNSHVDDFLAKWWNPLERDLKK
jgi:hypothetical protein